MPKISTIIGDHPDQGLYAGDDVEILRQREDTDEQPFLSLTSDYRTIITVSSLTRPEYRNVSSKMRHFFREFSVAPYHFS